MEYERLVAYFDGDSSGIEKAGGAALRVADAVEKRFKSLFSGKIKVPDFKLPNTSSVTSSIIKPFKDFSTGNITAEANKLASAFKTAKSEGTDYQETLRRFAPELNRLASALKKGASDQSDYNRRVSALPKEMREAISQTRRFGKEITETGTKVKSSSLFSGSLKGGIIGGLIGGGAAGIASMLGSQLKQFALDGRADYANLDKLTRFTATLDKNFQTPENLIKFRKDVEQLALVVPQKAEDIAQASFTIKSAYQNLTEPELIEFLREFSVAATASNTTVDIQADQLAGLAAQYKITANELQEFFALMSTGYGAALASDAEVGKGFNKLIVSASSAKIPLKDIVAAMASIQSTANDAEANTTNLLNAIQKLGDGKYIERLKEVFNIDRINKNGSLKGLNEIVNELAKSLNGLSDGDQLLKLNQVFKDQQANLGIKALITNVQRYNEMIANGADSATWNSKVSTMLGSAEARWAKYTAYVTQVQRSIGEGLSSNIDSILSQQSGAAKFESFFINIGAGISKGFLWIAEQVGVGSVMLAGAVAKGWDLLTGGENLREIEAWQANLKSRLISDNEKLYVAIDNQRASRLSDVRQRDLEYYRRLMFNPEASEQVKAEATKNFAELSKTIADGGNALKTSLEALAKNTNLSQGTRDQLQKEISSLGDAAKKGADDAQKKLDAATKDLRGSIEKLLGDSRISDGTKSKLREEIARLGDEAAKGVKQAEPKIEQSGKEIGKTWNQSISDGLRPGGTNPFLEAQKRAIDPNLSAAQTSGQKLGQTFGDSTYTSLLAQQDKVENGKTILIEPLLDFQTAQEGGTQVGTSFGEGIYAGMSAWITPIGIRAAEIVRNAIAAAKAAQDSHSPSRRAAREIGAPFVQGIEVGMIAEAGNLAKTAENIVDNALFATLAGATSLKSSSENSGNNSISFTKGTGYSERKPKNKKVKKEKINPDDATRAIIEGLSDSSSAIDSWESRSVAAAKRFWSAALGDERGDAATQAAVVNDYFSSVYQTEKDAYDKRLLNIDQREAEINKLTKIKADERKRELFRLGEERLAAEENWAQRSYDINKEASEKVTAIVERNIARVNKGIEQRQKADAIAGYGQKISNEQAVNQEYKNRLELINNEISTLTVQRDGFAENTDARITLENKLIAKIDERTDTELDRDLELKAARAEDLQDRREFVREMSDLMDEAAEAQTEAERTELDLLKGFGADKETVRRAELAFAKKSEDELYRLRLKQLDVQKQEQIENTKDLFAYLNILSAYNKLIEAENARHAAAQTLVDQQFAKKSLRDRLREQYNDLPSYREQFENDIAGLPAQMASVLGGIKDEWDGTWGGLFKATARGFGQMLLDMANQYLQSAVSKIIGQLLGSFLGALGGGGSAGPSTGGPVGIGGHFANGGVPPLGRVSLVGERGPELFVPHSAGTILSNENSRKLLNGSSGSGQTVINNNFNQTIAAPRGLVAPKSARQAAEAAMSGVSNAMRNG